MEALQDRVVVHANPDELQRNLPPHRFGLLGEPYLTHPALANSLDQSIGTDQLRALCVLKKPVQPGVLRKII